MGHQRRDYEKVPPITDVNKYGAEWWAWWKALQPNWREVGTDGRPLQRGEGEWDVLGTPGKSGFLLVLLSLMWWCITPGAAETDCKAAVDDVLWVLTAVLVAEQAASTREQSPEPREPVQRQAKRRASGGVQGSQPASKRSRKHH